MTKGESKGLQMFTSSGMRGASKEAQRYQQLLKEAWKKGATGRSVSGSATSSGLKITEGSEPTVVAHGAKLTPIKPKK